jgi:hypothetical protein
MYSVGPDREASLEVLEQTITTLQEALNKDEVDREVVVCGGVRYCTKKKAFKHSFHVTFPGHTFPSMEVQKAFMKHVFADGYPEGFDTCVYSNGRVMRIPWSPKGKAYNSVLLPMEMDDDGWKNVEGMESFDDEFFAAMDIVPRGSRPVISHEFNSRVNIARPINREVRNTSTGKLGSDRIMEFWSPLMPVLIGHIQDHRRFLLDSLPTSDSRAGVPIKESVVFEPPEWSGREGVFKVRVVGDTFCEHDSPNYHHSTGDKITLSINFIEGFYNQMCFACNPTGSDFRKYGLFDDNGICVEPYDRDLTPKLLPPVTKHGAILFLQSLRGNILYHPSFDRTVYVYDENTKLWMNCAENLHIISKFKNQFRERFQRYYKHALRSRTKEQLAGAKDDEKSKILTAYRNAYTIDPNKDQQGNPFMENLLSNYASAFSYYRTEQYELNHMPHLVPLNDGTCFNVYSGEIVPRTREMRFTSMMACSMKVVEDEDCQEVRDWFLEVSSGRPDLAQYLQRLIGYCSTLLTDDRHFYVNLGIGRNGKGVLHRFIKVPHTQLVGFEPTCSHQLRARSHKFLCVGGWG